MNAKGYYQFHIHTWHAQGELGCLVAVVDELLGSGM